MILAAFLGLALGYVSFYAIFPNVSVPTGGEPSLAFIVAVLASAAILAGFETENVPLGILQIFLALPLTAVVTVGLAFTPLLSPYIEVRGDELAFLVLRLGLPIVVIGAFVFFVFTFVGLWIRERVR